MASAEAVLKKSAAARKNFSNGYLVFRTAATKADKKMFRIRNKHARCVAISQDHTTLFLNLHPVKFQQFSATTSRKKSCSLAREPKRWDDNTGSLQCTDLRALPQSSHSPCTHKKPKHSYTGCQSYSFSPAANAPNLKRRNTVTFSVYPSISLWWCRQF